MLSTLRYLLYDLVPVTPRVYLRLIQRQNEAVWPTQILTLLLGFFLLYRSYSNNSRYQGLLLAAYWTWVGISFHLQLYANLTWFAEFLAYVFLLQAGALLVREYLQFSPDFKRSTSVSRRFGLGLAGFALVFYPFLAPLLGRPWSGAELVGITPDATVLFTLGLVLTLPAPRWFLMIIPFLYTLVGGFTSLSLGLYAGLLPPVLASTCLLFLLFSDH